MSTVKASSSGLRAVVFDLDGTLIDSIPLVLRAFTHALEPFRPELTEADIFMRLGGPPERTMAELVGDDEARVGEALRRLETFGFANAHLVQPFDGMRDMLVTLRGRGLKLALWTGRDRTTTEAIMSAHELAVFFDAVICGDDLPTHKPHPGGLEEIFRSLSVSADQAFLVGDADADVLGGSAAGVKTLLIRHAREPDAAVIAKAWGMVDAPAEAYRMVMDRVAHGITPLVPG
jgi:HAD superfamily hydrolase (TIGR01549 family)